MFRFLITLIITLPIIACGGSSGSPAPEISLDKQNITLSTRFGAEINEAVTVTANVSYTMSSNVEWLRFRSEDGTSRVLLTIPDWSLIDSGENIAVLTLSNEEHQIARTITFILRAEENRLYTSKSSLLFTHFNDFSDTRKTVNLYTSDAPLDGFVTVSSSVDWLNADFADNKININVDETQIQNGFHSAQLVINASDLSTKNPAIINVGFFKSDNEWNNVIIPVAEANTKFAINPYLPHVYTLSGPVLSIYHSFTGELILENEFDEAPPHYFNVDSTGEKLIFATQAATGSTLSQYNIGVDSLEFSGETNINVGYSPFVTNITGIPVLITSEDDINTTIVNLKSLQRLERQGNFGPWYEPAYAATADQKYLFNLDYGIGSNTMPLHKTRVSVHETNGTISINNIETLDSDRFNYATRLVVTPDGSRAYVTSNPTNDISVINTQTDQMYFDHTLELTDSSFITGDAGLYQTERGSLEPGQEQGSINIYSADNNLITTIFLPLEHQVDYSHNKSLSLFATESLALVPYVSAVSNGLILLPTGQ